ncbi:MAG: putative metal-binding motif-containing protein [Alphaproteobacteria bacterium]|nr:putative metal-binding motif-containing protein [Alphaproteobacteria bacterium]
MRLKMIALLALAACDNKDVIDTADVNTDDSVVAPADEDDDGYDVEADCDDGDPAVHPGADEVCDGVDNNCDGTVDEDATDAPTWYPDADADTFGDPASPATACAAPEGHVADATDCDDADATVHPGADEVCDGVDQDCDGEVDEDATDAPTWYADADADTFGDPTVTVDACEAPEGHVADATDCDDADATVHPDAIDDCDRIDNDCDESIDEGIADTVCEDFEADTDLNINLPGDMPYGWTQELPWEGDPPQTWEVTDSTSANGDQCLSTFDQDQGGNLFVIRAFRNYGASLQPGYIQLSLRWDSYDSTGSAYILFGDTDMSDDDPTAYDAYPGQPAFRARVRETQELDVTGLSSSVFVNAGEWVRVEWKNIDWTNGTVDVYLNDTLMESGTFDHTIGAIRSMYLLNDDQEMYWDRIQLRER